MSSANNDNFTSYLISMACVFRWSRISSTLFNTGAYSRIILFFSHLGEKNFNTSSFSINLGVL